MTYLDSPSTDCSNTNGQHPPQNGDPGCWKHAPMEFQGRLQGDFPHVQADNYSGR
jgi:hypothetical protein